MARVEYSAEINELKGSIAGTTFQRNKSGTIAKKKPSLVFNPTGKQVDSQQLFNSVCKNWASVSFANKLLWATFASTYQKYNYWGVQKNLSGFNWWMHVNANRYLCGQAFTDTPPTYVTPLSCPTFKCLAVGDGLSIFFDSFPEINDYYLFVYATPPIRSINLQSRRSLRLIAVFSPDNLYIKDITDAWESYFGLSWPAASSSNAYNSLIAVSCIDSTSFISGQFFLDNAALDLSTDPQAFTDSYTDLGNFGGENNVRVIQNIGNGVMIMSTSTSGLIWRSTDYGANWSNLGNTGGVSNIYDFVNCDSGIIVATCGTNGKILRSTDYGSTWSDLGQLGTNANIQSGVYLGNGIVVVGTANNGEIWRSTDYGATWSNLGAPGAGTVIFDLVVCGPGIIVACVGTSSYVYRSTDYGLTWSDLGALGTGSGIGRGIYLGDGIVLLNSRVDGVMFRSTDYGLTYTNLGQLGSSVIVNSILYVGFGVVLLTTGTNSAMYRSLDYGLTYELVNTGVSGNNLTALMYAFDRNIFFGSFNTGRLFRSSFYS